MTVRPFIPVPNTVSVELIYTLGGVVAENVIHIQKGAPYTTAEIQSLRALMIAWFTNPYRNYVSNQVLLTRVRIKALDSGAAPMEDYALPTPIPGGGATGALPNNVSFCVKLATGLAGRSQRGRWYVFGLGGAYVANSVDVYSSYASGLVGTLNTLISTLAAGAQQLVITSFKTGGVWRTTGHNTVVSTATYVDLHIDSQRRRLLGRGQ